MFGSVAVSNNKRRQKGLCPQIGVLWKRSFETGRPKIITIRQGSASDFGPHLRRQSPLVSVASGQVTPFGAPSEHTTETKVSPSSQETVVFPVTTRS